MGNFTNLVDFIVMDMEEDQEIPILLGQSFLKTARALIDGHQGKIDFRLWDEEKIFISSNLSKRTHHWLIN